MNGKTKTNHLTLNADGPMTLITSQESKYHFDSSHYVLFTAYHLDLVDNYFGQLDNRYPPKVFVWPNEFDFKSNLNLI